MLPNAPFALKARPAPIAPRTGDAPIARYVAATRVRLWELPTHLLCSIVGTCLSTGELRRVLGRSVAAHRTDVEVHTEGVSLAADRTTGKPIQKALEQRHAGWIRRLGRSADLATLNAAWDEALASGDVPGAYWALMSHAATDGALTKRAFGDVHMLSHLVGSSNRADLRRLAVLERERAELADRLDRPQVRLHGLVLERDALAARCVAAPVVHPAERGAHPGDDECQRLRAIVAAYEERLALSEQRRRAAQERLVALRERVATARADAADLLRERASLLGEIDALERLQQPRIASTLALGGRAILYVGGQPATLAAMHRLVEGHGGRWLHHDGGVEERAGLLAGLVSRCDVALFPVDCVSHEAALALKRLCRQADRPFVALRSAGLSSLVAALERDAIRSSPPAA